MTRALLADWPPARRRPETYPGDCPAGSYLLLDDQVHPIGFERPGPLASAHTLIDDRRVRVDDLLRARGLAPLADRFPSLAYGANRNPGTLAIKMEHYGYQGPDDGLVVPVLRGATTARDVVGCGLSGQGYLYADLLVAEDPRDEARVEAWFPLLDDDQLRVMHDGEHVGEGLYTVARYSSWLDDVGGPVDALGYAGNDAVFVSPELDAPLAYSSVHVDGRSLPSMDALDMLAHVIRIGGLEATLPDLPGPGEAPLVQRTMAFLNDGWWRRFHGIDPQDERYETVVRQLDAVIEAHRRPQDSAGIMGGRGRTLGLDEAYAPSAALRLGNQLATEG